MAEIKQKVMGKYCKAYPISRFREYANWKEDSGNARKETVEENGEESEVTRALTENDHLYLQEDFVVTDGIFKNENIIFGDITDEWIDFCKSKLEFEVPDYAVQSPVAETDTSQSAIEAPATVE